MADTLESLEIKIQHNVSGADAGIDKVAGAISRLKTSLEGTPTTLKSLSESFKSLRDAFKNGGVDKINNIADGIANVAASLELVGEYTNNAVSLTTAIASLNDLKISTTSFTSVANGIKKVGEAAEKISVDAVITFERMADALVKLQGVDLSGLGAAMRAVGNVKVATDKTPLSGETQYFISTANEVEILRHKLITLQEAMRDAFDAGDMDKAFAFRKQIIDTEKAIEKASVSTNKWAKALSVLKSVASKVFGVIKSILSGIVKLFGSLLNAIKKVVRSIAKFAIKSISDGVGRLADNVKSMLNPLKKLTSSFGRIVFYRLIRTAIKEIGEAFKEGSERAYFFAKNFGDATKYISDALDRVSSGSFKMSNQMGAAWATLMATVEPILIRLINLVTKAADIVTQFFAVMSGSGTYLKAKDYTKAWADETEKGAAAAKEWRNQLMGFDEINRLEEQSGSSGKAADKYTDYENMFEEAKVANNLFQQIRDMIKSGEWSKLGSMLGEKFNELITKFDWAGWGQKIGKAIGGAINFAYNFLRTADFKNLGARLAEFLNNLGDQISFNNLGRLFTRLRTAIWDVFYGAITYPGAMKRLAINLSVFLLGAMQEMIDWLESLDPVKVATAIKDFFGNIKTEEIKLTFVKMVKTAWEKAMELKDELFPEGAIVTITAAICDFIKKIPWDQVVAELKKAFEILKTAFMDILDTAWPPDEREKFVEKLKEAIHDLIVRALKAAWGLIKEAIFGTGKDTSEGFGAGFMAGWHPSKNEIEKEMEEFIDETQDIYETHSPSKVFDRIGRNVGEGFFDGFKAKMLEIKTMLKNKLDEIKKLFDVTWSFPKIKMPHFSWTWQQVGKWVSIPRISVEWYAKGGFPDMGQLFVANEAGPEMVGTIGGRTAVAPNSDIVAAVREGVYDAVSSAMANNNSGNGTIVMNVNGREFMRATYNDRKAVDKEKGISLITNFA